MDKHKAHDIVHQWNGGKAENCPKCSGDMTNDEMTDAASEIANANYQPKVNPMLPYEKRIQAYKEEKDKEAEDARIAAEKAKGSNSDSDEKPVSDMRTIVDIMKFSEDSKTAPSRIKVLPIGNFKTKYGETKITKDMAVEMKKNFDSALRAGGKETGIPIDFEHGDTMYKDAAAGWLKELHVMDDGVYADSEWTKLGKDALESGIYKFYSPEFYFNYKDPETGELHSNVMTGGGLVNKPTFTHSLPRLVASEKEENKNLTKEDEAITLYVEARETSTNKDLPTMELKAILAKEKSTRTSEEAKFLADHKEELTFAEAKTEGFAADASTTPVKAAETKTEDGKVSMDEKEVKTLQEQAAAGFQASEKFRKMELKEEIKKLAFTEKGAKIATDQVDSIVELMMTMNEDQQKQYKDMLEKLPVKELFSENGSSDATEKGSHAAAEELVTKAREYAKENKVAFSEAVKIVASQNPELAKESQTDMPLAMAER